MINQSSTANYFGKTCLTDVDLYRYIASQGSSEELASMESHMAGCDACRRNLADLLDLLHPESGRDMAGVAELPQEDMNKALGIIREVSRKEQTGRSRFGYGMRWPLAAAAAIGFLVLGILLFRHLYEIRKSEVYFAQGRKVLEQNYTGSSPSKLRLTLPFIATSIIREPTGNGDLRAAENLFYQALAFREEMVEAHLGLACIYLNESKFSLARAEFQKVLDIKKDHVQALIGRGVARYEEAAQGPDPLQRSSLLRDALGDFNAALKLKPHDAEARYDKIWTLFESGIHTEALQEIDAYLSRDSNSGWAEELRGLKTRMKATKISVVEKDVLRAAAGRNKAVLVELARHAPYQLPAIILSAIGQSLEADPAPAIPGRPNSEDLRWAAETMEAAYSDVSGDHSLRAPLDYYIGLSPPQRIMKRALDKELQTLGQKYRSGDLAVVLKQSNPLTRRYAELGDFWQLASLHHLRGNSFYLGNADFVSAEAEFRKMLAIADRIRAIDFTAKAMASLAMVYGMQRKFDDSLHFAGKLKALAELYRLEPWRSYACVTLGNQYRFMGQYEQSLGEYATALEGAYRLLDVKRILETLEYLGNSMEGLGNVQAAKDYYHQALLEQDKFYGNGGTQSKAATRMRKPNLLSKQGDLALRIGNFASAEKLYRESLKSETDGMIELEGRNQVGLAAIYLKTNRFRDAEDMLNAAMATSRLTQYPDVEWRARSLYGKLLEKTGRRYKAVSSLRQSIEILEHMRHRISEEEFRHSFFADRFDPFKTMVSILYKSSSDRTKTLEFVDRAKSLTLKEHLNQDTVVRKPPMVKLAVGRNSYSMIEYFWAEDELLAFLSDQSRIQAVSLHISKEDMSSQVRHFLESIRKNDSKAFNNTSRRLYDALIAPLEKSAFTGSTETLVILPDGPLHLLPFAGLQDQTGRFLIEKVALSYAPSRSIFQHCLSSNSDNVVENRAVLIDGSSGLPNARDEVNYLSRMFGRSASILSPKDAPAFRQAVARSGILHFSGHAETVQGKPALLLQASPRKIYLDCREINTWKMPNLQLANLAGCSTGIGPLAEGEAPWGLVPALLNAGAPSIIASLMSVDDRSTKNLNMRLYELMQEGSSKAKALQQAQVSLLNASRSGPDSKPQFWMPYILVGNPQ